MSHTVTFSQRWRLEDYVNDHDNVANNVFEADEQIQWLQSQGYTPRAIEYRDIAMDVIEYSLIFEISDHDRTFLLLKFPNHSTKHIIGE